MTKWKLKKLPFDGLQRLLNDSDLEISLDENGSLYLQDLLLHEGIYCVHLSRRRLTLLFNKLAPYFEEVKE